MFLGTYTPKLDEKGRLTLPAKFREALSGGVMVSKGQDHSLAVYTREEFAERVRRLTEASRSNPVARSYIRQLGAGTDEQQVDAQGRITLSAEHRRYANLGRNVVVNGSIEFIEIWNDEAWARYSSESEQSFSDAFDESLGGIL
ncbi:division/cell wall cluster transcriptional repressor MraZ [Rhodococcus sp. BP-252]|uniref:Transcriptional regulator MraZ n=1 Tax=Rhodococcoides kyotonense TaxID=398843 RepID=A0A177YPB4_9NOCA|nr:MULTISPECIES: division/cell wall cluster transcriptional repressor MraZ [Rhodococcus]NIL74487.1 Transcriptional regulator MraZ [Rhodococcus sp. B10]MBY6411360.1 division/cell wall cluster transcriptional repressor MraZ [Rhodococcus sp. BP-320]MBY6416019.1 division/cell wall cluster transcriptional repressor MraZ [Rhodococcus sp. BP-321]MBY6420472.1 division/cell wall cluster transcriptional repressor MraZ [Rhodococcus sp. BP-324]MBY6426226.1 division/cell wall cluster transcriptional repres